MIWGQNEVFRYDTSNQPNEHVSKHKVIVNNNIIKDKFNFHENLSKQFSRFMPIYKIIDCVNIKKIECSKNAIYVLTSHGVLYSFGRELFGELGQGYNCGLLREFKPVNFFKPVLDIVAGDHHCLALCESVSYFSHIF